MRKIRISRILFFIAVFIFISVTACFSLRTNILRLLASYLIYEDPLRQCEAVLILAGEFPDRAIAAADLYKDGFASKVIVPNDRESAGFNELRKRNIEIKNFNMASEDLLLKLGVNEDDLIRFDAFTDRTKEEALSLLNFVKAKKIKGCIIIVTNRYHSRRAGIIFRKVLRESGVEIITRTPKFDDYDPSSWWKNPREIRSTAAEYMKLFALPLY